MTDTSPRLSRQRAVAFGLTIAFGAFPMAGLVFLAVPSALFVSAFTDQYVLAAVVVLLGVAATGGYVALVFAAARPVTERVAFWLVAGLVGNAFTLYFARSMTVTTSYDVLAEWYWYAPSLLLGAGHLLVYGLELRRRTLGKG